MSNKITHTKKDLIDLIHKKINIPKNKIQIILETVLGSMEEIFTKDQSETRLEIRNFGIFEIKKTKPKPKARNPKTNEMVYVPSRRKISFKAGKKISGKLKKEWNDW